MFRAAIHYVLYLQAIVSYAELWPPSTPLPRSIDFSGLRSGLTGLTTVPRWQRNNTNPINAMRLNMLGFRS